MAARKPQTAHRSEYADLESKCHRVWQLLGIKDPLTAAFREKLYISWIYHDSAQEGIVMSIHELKSSIDDNIVSDISLIPMYQHIKNHIAAIRMVEAEAINKKKKVGMELLGKLHALFLQGEEGEPEPGKYRKEMPLHRTYFHEIHLPNKISAATTKWVRSCESPVKKVTHPLVLAANTHDVFMHIFPYDLHTGKIGRLIMNLILIRHGLLPAIIHAVDRQKYYECLRAQTGLVELLAESMHNTANSALRELQPVAGRLPKTAHSR